MPVGRHGSLLRVTLGIALMLAFVVGIAANNPSATADVDPPSFSGELDPGESVVLDKEVDVPGTPTKADVYFLADTTGSMGGVISQVKTDAAAVLSSIQGSIADVQFGAGDYKDFPFDSYAFQHSAAIGPDDGVGGAADASDAIDAWSAGGGFDGSEGQFFALDQIADPGDPAGVGWRMDATRIVVWFGDAPAHDPVCAAISGLGYDIDEASVTAKLVGTEITVVAISTTTGFPSALDDDPTSGATDYVAACGAPGGSSGQATRIAAATSGAHLTGVAPADIADAITDGIEAITLDITAQAVGCDPLVISWDPASHDDVTGPTTVTFEETIMVPDGTPAQVINCVVQFLASRSVIAEQEISVTIPGGEEPTEALCYGHKVTILGTNGDDVIMGTNGADVIHGLDGDDDISGLAGNDIICGGSGDDTIGGGSGNDVILSGEGDDWADGGTGHDLVDGGPGDDTLIGGDDHDWIWGEEGDDTLMGKAGQDILSGGEGDDVLFGDANQDILNGSDGDDKLYGGSGQDILNGGGEDDSLFGESNQDILNGDRGDDTLDGDGGFDICNGGIDSDAFAHCDEETDL